MIDPKGLHRRIEHALVGLPSGGSAERFASRLTPRVLDELGPLLGLAATHLYRRGAAGWALSRKAGESRPDLGDELARRLGAADDGGIRDLPWVGDLGPGHLALVPVGDDDRALLALFTAPPGGLVPVPTRGSLASAVAALHYAIGQHLRRRELEDLFAQARAIQTSLLPAAAPAFEGFEIAARSAPARDVGGDYFDYLDIDDDTLGLAVADASGHGLPAALQARDVATGLRMGVARDLKIPRTIEKLNRVIHRSGLVTRFISLFYGELNRNGNLFYINAGHPPAQMLDDEGFHELTRGGLILGPDPASTYKQGFAHLDRGAMLALYTDGVIERGIGEGAGPGGFGTERVREWMRDWHAGPLGEAVDDLFRRLEGFADGGPFDDDVTVMLVRRTR
jgi:sigma-B regulation protein RsbU (phosphoserine phosphatase)